MAAATDRNVYVAGLPADFDDAQLRVLFSKFGAILSTKFCPRPGSVAYGFVNFGSASAAQTAIAAMDGKDYRGVALQARLASMKAFAPGTANAGYPGAGTGSRSNVYVAGWPSNCGEVAFKKAFEPFGKIVSHKLVSNKSQAGRVYGFVCFESEAAAHKAIHSMNGTLYGGVELQARLANKTDENNPEPVKARVSISEDRKLGVVNDWKGKYGWIVPSKPIKHADAVMHNGRVFVHMRDCEGINELREGDAVSFVVYQDKDGLGAADVRLEEHLEQGGGEDEAGQEVTSNGKQAPAAKGSLWRRHQPKSASISGVVEPSTQSPQAGSRAASAGTDIYVKGWPPKLTDADFYQEFAKFGSLLSLDLRVDQAPGSAWTGRKHGYARFDSSRAAEAAVEGMDSVVYGGVALQVSLGSDDSSPSTASNAEVEPGLQMQVRIGESRYFGKVLQWKGNHGWIHPERRIDIRDQPKVKEGIASMHRGRIYVNERDIEGASELTAGDRVSFVAYADWDGLGASEVRREARAEVRKEVRTRIRALAAPTVTAKKPPPSRGGNALGSRATPSTSSGVNSSGADAGIGDVDRSPGNAAAGNADGNSSSLPAPPAPWWHGLAGDCCAISLTPFEEMEHEPFGLLGTSEAREELPEEGLWGASAVAAFYSMQAVHWFHGLFVACSLVTGGQFTDPVSLRPLSRGECESLDRYLAFHNFPTVHVTEAFDLGRQVAETGDGSRTDASKRFTALGREAASIMRIYDEGEVPPAVTSNSPSAPPSSKATAVTPDARLAPKAPSVVSSPLEATPTASSSDVEKPPAGPTYDAAQPGVSVEMTAGASATSDPGAALAKEGGRRRRWQK